MNERNNQNLIYDRELLLIGKNNFQKIQNTLVILCGLGGVGSYAFESLLRAGIKNFILIDCDKYEVSNMNRQLYATSSALGKYKTDVAKERALQINQEVNILCVNNKLQDVNINFLIEQINCNFENVFIADCVDDIEAKLFLYNLHFQNNYNLISCMGTGNRITSCKFKIAKLNKTANCPLAKSMRKNVKTMFGEKALSKIDVIYSEDKQIAKIEKIIPSISFIPSRAGLLVAEYIINKIIKI